MWKNLTFQSIIDACLRNIVASPSNPLIHLRPDGLDATCVLPVHAGLEGMAIGAQKLEQVGLTIADLSCTGCRITIADAIRPPPHRLAVIELQHLVLIYATAPPSETRDRLNQPLRDTGHRASWRCK